MKKNDGFRHTGLKNIEIKTGVIIYGFIRCSYIKRYRNSGFCRC